MQELEKRLARVIADYPEEGRYSTAVTDLQTGETISVNGDRQQLGGCIMNLFVLILTEQDLADGEANPATVLPLIDKTIYGSNATTALELYEIAGKGDAAAGVERVANLIAALGMDDTVIDHPPGYQSESIGVSANNFITALDANRALAAIYDHTALTEPQRSDLLYRMTNVKPGLNYLLAYGTGGLVSHKNGFLPLPDDRWVDNDVAIVRFDSDREYAYAISFFSEDVTPKYADIALGQEISRMAWAFFARRYR